MKSKTVGTRLQVLGGKGACSLKEDLLRSKIITQDWYEGTVHTSIRHNVGFFFRGLHPIARAVPRPYQFLHWLPSTDH